MTVARAVGVSPTTVSNAYNRPHKLSPALRERILGAARDLGYPGPHPAARSLRRGRAGSIGLLFGEALTYAFQDPGAVEGVGERLRSEEHTPELQSQSNHVCRLLLEKKNLVHHVVAGDTLAHAALLCDPAEP